MLPSVTSGQRLIFLFLVHTCGDMSPQERGRSFQVDDAYPVRIKFRLHPRDVATQLEQIHTWLHDVLGPSRFGPCFSTPYRSDALTIYLRTVEEAALLVRAFPQLTLADDVDRLNAWGLDDPR